MTPFWTAVFWSSILFVGYAYAGYPLLLLAARRFRGRTVRARAWEPFVTVVVAARNEREAIATKIRNLLALDYPRPRLQVVIALDGCTDGTGDVVRAHADAGVEMVQLPEHRGKAVALNAALERARGEVIVFADVRQHVDTSALRALVRELGDPEVGAVSGELVLLDENGSESREGVGLYWRYEKAIRAWESAVHSVVGATGALYAMRREAVIPLPAGAVLDDVLLPLGAVLAGKRCVFAPAARVFDRVACCTDAEYARKVRTLAGNFQMLAARPELLDPRRNPIWLQFVSHKVARLLVPYALAAAFLSNLFLTGLFYDVLLAGQIAFYALALLGMAVESARPRVALAPAAARGELS